jgi:membrane associated rhomboid family serine protease
MTKNIFVVRNMFCPHKDYTSFLGGKLIVFKLCNYGIVLGKVSRAIFGIVSAYFLFMRLILLLVNFCRTIRVVYVYFVMYALFSYL